MGSVANQGILATKLSGVPKPIACDIEVVLTRMASPSCTDSDLPAEGHLKLHSHNLDLVKLASTEKFHHYRYRLTTVVIIVALMPDDLMLMSSLRELIMSEFHRAAIKLIEFEEST